MSIAEPRESLSLKAEPSEPEQASGSASEYLNRVLRKPGDSRPSPTVPVPPPQPPRKSFESDRPEVWYHVRIEDGIELRVREDRYRDSKGRLQAVIDTLRTTLRRYGMLQRDQGAE